MERVTGTAAKAHTIAGTITCSRCATVPAWPWTLAITVHPDLRVSVVAPLGADAQAIRAKVHKRASWIRDQWRELELYLPKQPPRRYVNGETHRYLGRQYRLRAQQGPEDSVKRTPCPTRLAGRGR